MPHIKPNPPRPPPPPFPPIRPDPDERDDNRLARAIKANTEATIALTEWLQANRAAVTKADLSAAKGEILKAIAAGSGVNEAAVKRLGDSLDRMDAQVPDK